MDVPNIDTKTFFMSTKEEREPCIDVTKQISETSNRDEEMDVPKIENPHFVEIKFDPPPCQNVAELQIESSNPELKNVKVPFPEETKLEAVGIDTDNVTIDRGSFVFIPDNYTANLIQPDLIRPDLIQTDLPIKKRKNTVLTPEQRERNQDRARKIYRRIIEKTGNIYTAEQREYHNMRNRVRNRRLIEEKKLPTLTPEQRQRRNERERERVKEYGKYRTPEQRERVIAKYRVANLTEDQREKARLKNRETYKRRKEEICASRRYENLTEAQREHHRARKRESYERRRENEDYKKQQHINYLRRKMRKLESEKLIALEQNTNIFDEPNSNTTEKSTAVSLETNQSSLRTHGEIPQIASLEDTDV